MARFSRQLGGAGAAVTPVASSVSPNVAPGTILTAIKDPFAGLGLGTTSYVTYGVVPGQLALVGSNIVAGATQALGLTDYSICIEAISGDGNRTLGDRVTLKTTVLIATPIQISGSPGAATQNSFFSFTPTTQFGSGTKTFAITAGTLPSGLTINSATGQISGTPSVFGTFNGITITVTDTTTPASLTISLSIAQAIFPIGISGTPTGLQQFEAYNFTPTTQNGSGTKSFAITAGTLPTGLSFNTANGAITGKPSVSGSFPLTITVTDSTTPANLSITLVVAVTPVITISGTPAAPVQGVAYSFTPTITNGTGARTYTTTGTFPAGLTVNASTGALTGTATVSGTFASLAIVVTDNSGSASLPFSLVVAPKVVALGTPGIAQQGRSYTFQPNVTGGSGTKAFALTGGTLPAGLTFSTSTGKIGGTPTAAGTTSGLGITVTDLSGSASIATFALNVLTLPAQTTVFNPALSNSAIVISNNGKTATRGPLSGAATAVRARVSTGHSTGLSYFEVTYHRGSVPADHELVFGVATPDAPDTGRLGIGGTNGVPVKSGGFSSGATIYTYSGGASYLGSSIAAQIVQDYVVGFVVDHDSGHLIPWTDYWYSQNPSNGGTYFDNRCAAPGALTCLAVSLKGEGDSVTINTTGPFVKFSGAIDTIYTNESGNRSPIPWDVGASTV